MIPISDENPTLRTPVMTYAILGAMLATWILVQGAGTEPSLMTSVCNLGMVPGELTHRAALGTGFPIGRDPATGQVIACVVDNERINIFTPLISMFLHGGWMHLLGNALYFWVFGNNVEDSMGRVRFVVFYILCGLCAAAAHVVVDPSSPIPTVGASGAISGVLGAYLVLYPRVRVKMLFFFILVFIRAVPAWFVLLWWFGLQVLSGLPQLMQVNPEVSGGVAVWAHVGGFIAGVALVKIFENPALVRRRTLVSDAHGVWEVVP